MNILKEEINQSVLTIVDLSKWKLLVLAILSAAGLGLLKDVKDFEYGYILLFLAPYVCCYVDMIAYERIANIHLIAQFLRQYDPGEGGTSMVKDYEVYIREKRKHRAWVSHEARARLVSSLVCGIGIPSLALLVKNYQEVVLGMKWILLIPALGVIGSIYIYSRLTDQLDFLEGSKESSDEGGLAQPSA